MQRRMARFKGKHYHGRGNGKSVADVMQETAVLEDEEEEVHPTIARRKRFQVAPMDEYEAIEQMELLGHENFFVFYNVNRSAIDVLYRRHDGTYGLIEPDIAF